MSKTRCVNTKFWDDEYIMSLDPTEKLLFLYFLTNPLTNIAGCYQISKKRIAFDTTIDDDRLSKAIDKFKNDDKIYYIDGWLFIKNFIKNQSMNAKVRIGIELILKEIQGKVKGIQIDYDRLYIGFDNPNPNSNSNSNLNSNPNSNIKDNKFKELKKEALEKIKSINNY